MGEFKVLLIAKHQVERNAFLCDALRKFGGYTVGPKCHGVWVDQETKIQYTDDVLPVYVATDDTSGVIRLVDKYREVTGEVCVYLRHPNGTVQLVGLK